MVAQMFAQSVRARVRLGNRGFAESIGRAPRRRDNCGETTGGYAMSTEPRPVPCGNLIECAPTRCALDKKFPEDCERCDDYAPGLTDQERTRCEVWTRVMGYHRPVSAFNDGKRAEHAERRYFRESADAGASAPHPGVAYSFAEGAGHD